MFRAHSRACAVRLPPGRQLRPLADHVFRKWHVPRLRHGQSAAGDVWDEPAAPGRGLRGHHLPAHICEEDGAPGRHQR